MHVGNANLHLPQMFELLIGRSPKDTAVPRSFGLLQAASKSL